MKLLKYVIITLLFVLTFVGGFGSGYLANNGSETVAPMKYPTGQEVLDELNAYRQSQNLPPFELSEKLCNNISERWAVYKDKQNHEGFEEFSAKYHPGMKVSESQAFGYTVDEVVGKWKSSPSHNQALLSFTKVCVYSHTGYTVALLSN